MNVKFLSPVGFFCFFLSQESLNIFLRFHLLLQVERIWPAYLKSFEIFGTVP